MLALFEKPQRFDEALSYLLLPQLQRNNNVASAPVASDTRTSARSIECGAQSIPEVLALQLTPRSQRPRDERAGATYDRYSPDELCRFRTVRIDCAKIERSRRVTFSCRTVP